MTADELGLLVVLIELYAEAECKVLKESYVDSTHAVEIALIGCSNMLAAYQKAKELSA